MWQELLEGILRKDTRLISRAISMIENEVEGYEGFLRNLPANDKSHIIGITGPPGAGKSTLTDGLIDVLLQQNKRVAVLCVDPSSPFHRGAILGDRIRMNGWYNHPNVYIRSLASRGSLGGTCPMIIEITELLKTAGFDQIIIETVGVGQSEVEIAGIADTTVVVLVPESGDDIQGMKAGLMEVADIIVVNKADRPGADVMLNQLRLIISQGFVNDKKTLPVLKTTATHKEGLIELWNNISARFNSKEFDEVKQVLMAEKIYQLILRKKMKDISKEKIIIELKDSNAQKSIFRFLDTY